MANKQLTEEQIKAFLDAKCKAAEFENETHRDFFAFVLTEAIFSDEFRMEYFDGGSSWPSNLDYGLVDTCKIGKAILDKYGDIEYVKIDNRYSLKDCYKQIINYLIFK